MKSWAYPQARLQARFGQCLSPRVWRALEGIEAPEAFLEEVRHTPLAPWVAGMTSRSGIHEVELSLREGFRRHIREVAAWVPERWRGSILWLVQLVDLPAWHHLFEGREIHPWMRRDPALQPFLAEDPEVREKAFLSSELAPLFQKRDALLDAWKGVWRERLPCLPPALGALAREVEEHLKAFPALPPQEAWAAREALLGRFVLAFRRAVLQPTSAFAYLGGLALTLERLRGNVVRRL